MMMMTRKGEKKKAHTFQRSLISLFSTNQMKSKRQLGKMLPPQALQQMGGAGALHGLLKAFEGATGAGGKGLFG